MIYTPGVKKGKEAFAQVKDKDIYVILIDPKEKVVQYEVRTKLPEDGVQIQKRLLHSYFKYPLAMFLSKWNVLDATTFDGTYMQANRINIDSQSSIMLVAGKKKYSLAELSAGVIAAIVLGGLFVIVGMIVVTIKGRKQAKIETYQNQKSIELHRMESTLQLREQQLNNKIKQLNQEKSALLKQQNALKSDAVSKQAELNTAELKFKELALQETIELDGK